MQGPLRLCPDAVLNNQGFFNYGWIMANKLVHESRIMIRSWTVLQDEYSEKCTRDVALVFRCNVK